MKQFDSSPKPKKGYEKIHGKNKKIYFLLDVFNNFWDFVVQCIYSATRKTKDFFEILLIWKTYDKIWSRSDQMFFWVFRSDPDPKKNDCADPWLITLLYCLVGLRIHKSLKKISKGIYYLILFFDSSLLFWFRNVNLTNNSDRNIKPFTIFYVKTEF